MFEIVVNYTRNKRIQHHTILNQSFISHAQNNQLGRCITTTVNSSILFVCEGLYVRVCVLCVSVCVCVCVYPQMSFSGPLRRKKEKSCKVGINILFVWLYLQTKSTPKLSMCSEKQHFRKKEIQGSLKTHEHWIYSRSILDNNIQSIKQ